MGEPTAHGHPALWRLRGRDAFAALAREGRRGRSGPVTVVYRPTDLERPRVGYAVGRRVGTAVVRNTVRRRLRVLMADADPAPGDYLVQAAPAAAGLSSSELGAHLRAALDRSSRVGEP